VIENSKKLKQENSNESLRLYKSHIVTYGTSSASFLAIQSLQRLPEEQNIFPLAAEVIKRDFYVDDLMIGNNSFKHALQLQDKINNLLRLDCFK
jgi:hypothetical protein